jgi:hypothetical protein
MAMNTRSSSQVNRHRRTELETVIQPNPPPKVENKPQPPPFHPPVSGDWDHVAALDA